MGKQPKQQIHKPPKILAVKPQHTHPFPHQDNTRFYVTITAHQHKKIPKWVNTQAYHTDNMRHLRILVTAKDELQAVIRFKKLWAAWMGLRDEEGYNE